jgi:mannan endo-1,4-beta-mannosidase
MQVTYEVPPTNLQATAMNPLAISHWQAGGLVLVHYAPPNPVSNGHPGDLTNVVNLATLFTPGTATYTNWMRSLDLCADGLQQLRDAGVVVLFTILHENNGSWLWWHKRPRADYIALYRGVHDYFTNVRGLNNLLWIFHPSEATHDLLPMDYYYPGDDVVDLIGPSVYNSTFQFRFPMDDLFRAYPKAFGLTEANANINTNAWDLNILATNLAVTLPRAAYFCAWSSFKNGAAPLTRYSLVDNTNVTALLNAPHIGNRAAVDWATYLPVQLNLRRQGLGLTVDWAGGALDYSTNLSHWATVTNATQSWTPPPGGMSVFRVRRER